MKITGREVLVTGLATGVSKKTNESYVIIDFVDREDSKPFSVMTKDISIALKVKAMELWECDVDFSCTKFGLKADLDFKKKLGEI